MKKILVIKAHPKEKSFCNALTDKYIQGVEKSGNEVKVLNLKELDLEKYLKNTYDASFELSPDIKYAQQLILWADHLVFSYPIWWATPPALLKVFVEVAFQPGFAYKYIEDPYRVKWDKLLKGRTGRLVATMDAPPIFYNLLVGDPGGKMMINGILSFCGVSPVKKSYFGSVNTSNEKKKQEWLEHIFKVGMND